jgi:hypothetical protein
MVDSDLVSELDAMSVQIGGIDKLRPDAASKYVQRLAEAYVADPSSLRWWESLKVRAEHLTYGDADGLSQLGKLVDRRDRAMLVVTDDEHPPWPVYSGDVQKILGMLGGSRFFEYILAAQDVSWVVFDTHMNELVSAGLEV